MSGSGTITPITPVSPLSAVIQYAPYNVLSLEEWRRQISYHPYHFWQQANSDMPLTSACNTLVRQHSYQTAQFIGREEIREAIQRAEEALKPWLNFYPAPRFNRVTLPFPRYPKPDIVRLGYAGIDDRWITLKLPEGHIQAIGIETLSLLEADATVVYTDANGDGIIDTYTINMVAQAGIDITEVAIYFNAVDRYTEEDPSEKWRIKPISIRLDGSNWVIKGPSWLMIPPVSYEGFGSEIIDPSDAGNYVTTVDVYRRYADASGTDETTAAAVLIWETPPYPQINYNISFSTSDVAGYAWAIARCNLRDALNGNIGIGEAVYNTSTSAWETIQWWASIYKYKPPDRVIINYQAGFPLDQNGEVSHNYATAITRLAAAELRSPICACDAANRELQRWQFDLARTAGGGDEQYGMISREDLNNPFGSRRGQVEAWKFIKGHRNLTGFAP